LFGENTREARRKFQEEIDETHDLFKDFVKEHRPQIDIDSLSTGEHWSGTKAFELNLVDKIMTSDDYLLQSSKVADVYEIQYHKKKKLREKLILGIQSMMHKIISY
jgi:serine protease SohB